MTRLSLLPLVVLLALSLVLAVPLGALAQEVPPYVAGTYETSGLHYGVSAYVEVPATPPHVQPGTYSRCYVEMKAPLSTRPPFIQFGWNVGALEGGSSAAPVEYVYYLDTAGNYKTIIIGPATPGTKPLYKLEWDPLAQGWRVNRDSSYIATYKVFPAPGVPVAQGETSSPTNTMGPSHFDRVSYKTQTNVWYLFSNADPLYADLPYHISGSPSAFFVWGPIW